MYYQDICKGRYRFDGDGLQNIETDTYFENDYDLSVYMNDNYRFKILTKKEDEIDIDNIKELYISDIKSVGESEIKCWTGRNLDITIANKVNDLIKAVKQLDKK